jgi:hypothetical protein
MAGVMKPESRAAVLTFLVFMEIPPSSLLV